MYHSAHLHHVELRRQRARLVAGVAQQARKRRVAHKVLGQRQDRGEDVDAGRGARQRHVHHRQHLLVLRRAEGHKKQCISNGVTGDPRSAMCGSWAWPEKGSLQDYTAWCTPSRRCTHVRGRSCQGNHQGMRQTHEYAVHAGSNELRVAQS